MSSETERVLKRRDVDREHTWDLASVFPSPAAWEAERQAVIAALSSLAGFSGRLGESPAIVADFLEAEGAMAVRAVRLITYANMEVIVDTTSPDARARMSQATQMMGQFAAITSFAVPELQELGTTLTQWADSDQSLRIFQHYFEDLLRQKEHLRSAEVEQVLGLLTDPFSGPRDTASALTDSDLRFADAVGTSGETFRVGQTTIPPTGIQSADRERRRTGWENFSDGYLSVKNTLASNYLASVKQQVFNIQVRSYDSVLHSRLSPGNVPTSVFHNLIDTFAANLSTWHRYWDVRRRLLGVDTLYPYDQWAPLQDNQPLVSYDQAVDWCCASMAPLGDEYVSQLRLGCTEERWVDYEPNIEKRQGAAAVGGGLGSTRNFLYTSYDGTLQALSILTHELGHAMRGYLINQSQPLIYRGMGMSMVAETASNFNQALLRSYLMREKADDNAFQLALLDEAMFNFHRYFFIMPTLARFEFEVFRRAEKAEPLNADILNGIMGEFLAEGYGSTLHIDPDRSPITWAQFQHLYMPFYTFQYSIGISAAHALAEGVIAEDGEARQIYLNFLRAGDSRYPLEVFRLGGVDMTSPEPVEKAFGVLDDLVSRLEAFTS